MSRFAGLALLLVGLAWPFAVHAGLGHFAPWQFAVLLGALWLCRLVSGRGQPWLALAALLFCALLASLNNPRWLQGYPVLVNLGLLGLFGMSLLHGMPVAERLARLREPELPTHAIRYTRKVTQVWCLFFLFNGATAAALALWAPLAWWTLYTGVVAYALMGVLFAAEWCVRQRVRAHG